MCSRESAGCLFDLLIICLKNLTAAKVRNCCLLVAWNVGESRLGAGEVDGVALEDVELAGQGGHQVGFPPREGRWSVYVIF